MFIVVWPQKGAKKRAKQVQILRKFWIISKNIFYCLYSMIFHYEQKLVFQNNAKIQ